jgi:radical SAM superfamily enzyme YgiQ (UPF0313 family)
MASAGIRPVTHYEHVVYNNEIYRRNMADVVTEMKSLQQNYGVETFYFNDDNFLSCQQEDCNRISEFFDAVQLTLLNPKIRILTRSDAIIKWANYLKKWKSQGLSSVFIGFESALKSELSLMNKNTVYDQNFQAAKLLSEANIFLTIGFIMLSEGINDEGLIQNLNFLKSVDQLYRVTNLSRPLLGFPGTKLYSRWMHSGHYDKLRSTPFVLFPEFTDEYIRILSLALARVE